MNYHKLIQTAIELSREKDSDNININIKDIALNAYKLLIKEEYPNEEFAWPVVSGAHFKMGNFEKYFFVIMTDVGPTSFIQNTGVGNIFLPLDETQKTIKNIKKGIRELYNLSKRDLIFLIDMSSHDLFYSELERELKDNLKEHLIVMKKTPMKIFLSHKSLDKTKVREYKKLLSTLGFDPWIDEDAMSAGENLERSLQQGMKDSCSAIFFITPNYIDEKYLASEIDYAIARKRDDQNFTIITLVYTNDTGEKGCVPELLKPFVWKEPTSDTEAIFEIIKALPLQVGSVQFK